MIFFAVSMPRQRMLARPITVWNWSPVAVARVRYTYADYIATITASHTPYGGLAVREQYMSAVTAPGKGSPSG